MTSVKHVKGGKIAFCPKEIQSSFQRILENSTLASKKHNEDVSTFYKLANSFLMIKSCFVNSECRKLIASENVSKGTKASSNRV